MMNRWILTKETRDEFFPKIQEWLEKICGFSNEELEILKNEAFHLELSDTTLNPYTTMLLLQEFGFEKQSISDNGWELHFSIRMTHPTMQLPFSNELIIFGCGMTFDLTIAQAECL